MCRDILIQVCLREGYEPILVQVGKSADIKVSNGNEARIDRRTTIYVCGVQQDGLPCTNYAGYYNFRKYDDFVGENVMYKREISLSDANDDISLLIKIDPFATIREKFKEAIENE